MNPADQLRLAWLSLSRRPVRTAMTALGIAVAVTSMMIFLALGEGLRQTFISELGSVGPDIQVSRSDLSQGLLPPPDLSPETVTQIRVWGSELGIAEVTPVVVHLKQAFDPAESAVYYGLPPAQGIRALFSGVRPAQGRLLQAGDERGLVSVLGARAAQSLNVKIGDLVALNRRMSVRVVGILSPENRLTDTFTFLPLNTAQAAFGAEGRLSMVAIRLQRPEAAGRVANILSSRLHLVTSTRSDLLRFVGRLLSSVDVISLGLSVIALIVGGLAVINTIVMGVQERLGEFGTLRALGARPGVILRLVLTESLMLSLLGGAAGLLFGLFGTLGINVYTRHLAGIEGAALTPRLVLLTLGISALLGLLAGAVPARNASRHTIVAALVRA